MTGIDLPAGLPSHPGAVLRQPGTRWGALPVVDHYCGTEARMRRALALQQDLHAEFGTAVMDVTLDCEDGAPAGHEAEHAHLVAQIALQAAPHARVAVRVHAVDHPAFATDVATVVGLAGHRWVHLMVPKVESLADVDRAAQAVAAAGHPNLALHVLVESARAVLAAPVLAAHPAVQSISFGLMDFVSSYGGAIPAAAMSAQGQFAHPLVRRAKLAISEACHAYGKVPSHCVVTEFKDSAALTQAARAAATELGYLRMWSIHPDQVRPLLAAFAPAADDIARAAVVLQAAQAAQWGPVALDGQLHDRASYRYFWQVLQRGHQTGQALPPQVQPWFTESLP
jgi:citrate lyase subunit beta / citryl-CoA lyase